jgi:hypothetical protein
MFRMAPLFLLLAIACKKTPDPLADQRKTCQDLSDQKALKAGLSVDDCAKQLKSASDAASVSGTPKESHQNP